MITNQLSYPFLNVFNDFSESTWIFSIFLTFIKITFSKKIVTRKMLVCDMLLTKTYLNFVTFRLFFKIFYKIFKNVKKNSYGFWKINKFIWDKSRSPNYSWNNYVLFWEFFDNFSALLLLKILGWSESFRFLCCEFHFAVFLYI